MSVMTVDRGNRPRVLNPTAAVILAVIAVSLVVGMRALHDRQIAVTVEFLRSLAVRSFEAGDYRSAHAHLLQYLAMNPGDRSARNHLSWLLTEVIGTPRAMEQAYRINEELLRAGPGDDDIRKRQARTAVRLNYMADADAHLKRLRQSRPDDGEVWYLSAVVSDAARDREKAVHLLERAIECPSKVPESYALLAGLTSEKSDPQYSADALMTRMVSECPSGRTHHLRADYFIERTQYHAAVSELWMSLEETPDDMVLNTKLVRCLDAMVNERRNSGSVPQNSASTVPTENELSDEKEHHDLPRNLQRAVRHFEQRIAVNPHAPALRVHLAGVLWKSERYADAITTLESGIQLLPHAYTLHEVLIEYLVADSQPDKALRILESVPAGGFSRAVYHYCRGRILMAQQQWSDAAEEMELAIAHSSRSTGLQARARVSYALCRSRNGEPQAAIEAYRHVIAASPGSFAGRLGIASALVDAGQLELALGEYRQLKHLPGVSACLADLLIRRNLSVPEALQNWSEIDRLTQDESPEIHDPVQRLLLRADRFFASGDPAAAIRILETGRTQFPHRREIANAWNRVTGELSDDILKRLNQQLEFDPHNPELHTLVLNQILISKGVDAVTQHVHTLMSSLRSSGSRPGQTQLTMIRALLMVSETHRKSGATSSADTLLMTARNCIAELNSGNPAHAVQSVRILSQYGLYQESIRLVNQLPDSVSPTEKAAVVVEIARNIPVSDPIPGQMYQLLYEMVTQHSELPELRIHYAELLLLGRHHDTADRVLEPLPSATGNPRVQARAMALRAWLRAANNSDPDRALDLAQQARSLDPENVSHQEILARVQLSRAEVSTALQILDSIAPSEITPTTRLYRALALNSLNRIEEARKELASLGQTKVRPRFFPADEELVLTLIP